jgi:hypothetical protein
VSYAGSMDQDRQTSLMQDSVRLLLLLNTASEPVADPPPEEAPAGSVGVVRGQVLLQKLDFWVRNPDYLANELLNRHEADGNEADLTLAQQILESDEPELRSYPMLRHLFGAYEPLDEALAVLAVPGLVFARRRGGPGRTIVWNYYVTAAGREAAEHAIAEVPALQYYVDRTQLVVDLAGGKRGTALKDIQYLQAEYADAALGRLIASIATRTRARLRKLTRSSLEGQVQA